MDRLWDEDVLRFDAAVDVALGMNKIQSAGHLVKTICRARDFSFVRVANIVEKACDAQLQNMVSKNDIP